MNHNCADICIKLIGQFICTLPHGCSTPKLNVGICVRFHILVSDLDRSGLLTQLTSSHGDVDRGWMDGWMNGMCQLIFLDQCLYDIFVETAVVCSVDQDPEGNIRHHHVTMNTTPYMHGGGDEKSQGELSKNYHLTVKYF